MTKQGFIEDTAHHCANLQNPEVMILVGQYLRVGNNASRVHCNYWNMIMSREISRFKYHLAEIKGTC